MGLKDKSKESEKMSGGTLDSDQVSKKKKKEKKEKKKKRHKKKKKHEE